MSGIGMLAATFLGGMMLSMGIYFGWRWAAIMFGPIQTHSVSDVKFPPIVIRHE